MLTLFSILVMLCIVASLFFIPEIRVWGTYDIGDQLARQWYWEDVLCWYCLVVVVARRRLLHLRLLQSRCRREPVHLRASPHARTTGSDWTTYHDNNSRTGYLPNMPDPQR